MFALNCKRLNMQKLGTPLPNSPHAVSVSLPKWADVVGYEEQDPRVINAMETGYPRFVYHKLVKQLFADCENKFATEEEFCHAYPSKQIANWCVEYCGEGRIEEFSEGIFAVILPKELEAKAKEFWQHAGFGISSRQAESRRQNRETKATDTVKQKLSELSGADTEDIYLFPSGMAAIFTAHKLVGDNTAQLGFPYVDTLKIQEKFGNGEFVEFDDYAKLTALKPAAIFTEYPLNPMLQLVDFGQVRNVTGETPIIVDDTLCAWQNFNTLDHGDIAVTSLTKFFSSIGDVMAGSLILNKDSVHYQDFKTKLGEIYEDLLFADDAEVLAKNCQDFEDRISKTLDNAKQLTEFLQPYGEIRNHNGMITIILPTKEQAIEFYDNLEVAKGPSLGTKYTLASAYTILAHYHELDWAADLGVPAHLVRISVGCEEINELKEVFAKALKSV